MPFPSFHASAQAEFNPAPSIATPPKTKVSTSTTVPKGASAVGIPIAIDGDVPQELGVDRAALTAAGFDGKVDQVMMFPRSGAPALIAFGIGKRSELDPAKIRDAAAAFARAAGKHAHIAMAFVPLEGQPPVVAAQAMAEGVLLARYRYVPLKTTAGPESPLGELTVVSGAALEDIGKGLERGAITYRAVALARDLANAPATLLTARKMADIAKKLAGECGLDIEIFDEKALLKLGCGGMLGVNAGSAEPPRLIKLTYKPKHPTGRIALIGKGIMYDSGGISLKPNDLIHATMKGDMSGAAAVLGAMSTLSALGCKTEVTGYLMCTDNMPGGAAMKLGDVLTVRGGTTIEVMNTDAEGRLVMADGLVLATEQEPKVDAILDIATLTGACQRALGLRSAGVIGNHQALVDQVKDAADESDETVWQLPLDRRYRKELDSEIADMKNVGGDNAGAITAALFLDEFVAGIPWAHIDMAGTARYDTDDSWRPKGASGYGTRLLVELLMSFTPPAQTVH